ncbi:hypothetical protein [Falsiroseomonas oryzae]|uniref:hypothetical protein n=1 Tax=Falsiroseomonas oryzae TaxID=2766473 RepID=UPI0022EB865A|nr:hypothetical protein [Roseomonas sp. MO-31]
MPGDTHRTPLSHWSRDVARATVLAYRRGKADGLPEATCADLAGRAYVASGGDPGRVQGDLYRIISAAARDHGEWFWRPVRERLAREERYMRSIGMWRPPLDRSASLKPPADFE